MKRALETLKKYKEDEVEQILEDLYNTGRFLPLITERIVLKRDSGPYDSLHLTDTATLFYVRKGKVLVRFAEDEILVGVNNGVCIKMGVAHSIIPMSKEDPEIQLMIFHQSAVFGLGATAMSAKYRNPIMYSQTPDYVAFNCGTGTGVKVTRILDEIYLLRREESLGWELAVKGQLCNLWYLTIEMYRPIPVKPAEKHLNNDEYRVRRAINYIDEHYMDSITLDDIAENIHISKSECCRCFKRVLDLSPIEYVMRYRIYTAAAILDDTSVEAPSTSELATMTGHNNISYFIKTFKKYMGVTPTEFRNDAVNKRSWVDGSSAI